LFNKNTHSSDQKKPGASAAGSQDWKEFDQDYPFNSLEEADDQDWSEEEAEFAGAGSADSGIPSFGHTIKNGTGNTNGSSPNRPANPARPGLNTKGSAAQAVDLPASTTKAKNAGSAVSDTPDRKSGNKNKPAKPKRTVVKQDNRWRFFFGLCLFVVGLAGSILLVQTSTKGMEVIVATRDIAPGQPISLADLATARMSIPPDFAATLLGSSDMKTLTTGEDGTKPGRKIAARQLRAHQPIMQGDVVSPASLNKTGVPAGMVAMALPVSASTAVSRITPGDLVTLLYVNNKGSLADQAGVGTVKPGNNSESTNTTLAENITVLDVSRSNSGVSLGSTGTNTGGGTGSTADNTGTAARGNLTNLTLLLTLEEAERVALAKETGTINVVLLPFEIEVKQAENTPGTTKQGQAQPESPITNSPASLPGLTVTVTGTPGTGAGGTAVANPNPSPGRSGVVTPASPVVSTGPNQKKPAPGPDSTTPAVQTS
jgi:Flp pilus assembly protein CpaB